MDPIMENSTISEQQQEANPVTDLPLVVFKPTAAYRKVVYVQMLIVLLVLLIGAGVGMSLWPFWAMHKWYIFMIIGVFILFYTIYNVYYTKSLAYELTPHAVSAYAGIWVQKEQFIPYNRVQHVVLKQEAISRIWDLAELEVYAAGNQGGAIRLPGMPVALAETWKEHLLDQIQKRELVDE